MPLTITATLTPEYQAILTPEVLAKRGKIIINYFGIGCLFLLMSCAPVQNYNRISQPTNTQLVAGIGDTVISVSKEKNLPNAFGASDVFGRKTATGMVTVQYIGIKKGKAIFKRNYVDIETGATTMNSTPMVVQNSQTTSYSGFAGGTAYSGVATTSASPTIIPANTPQAQILDKGAVEIDIDLKKQEKVLVVEGKTISIISADDTKVVYSISE